MHHCPDCGLPCGCPEPLDCMHGCEPIEEDTDDFEEDLGEDLLEEEDLVCDPIGGPACRVCGCTDDQACPGGCIWAEPDLCSQCYGRARADDDEQTSAPGRG